MVKALIKLILIALVFASVQTPEVSATAQMSDDEYEAKWKDLHYQLFDANCERKSPEKTLELINRLDELYRDRTDEGTLRRASRIQSLLWATDVKEEKCTKEHIETYSELMNLFQPYSATIVPFLRHFLESQKHVCADQYHKIMEESVARLDANHKALVEDLINRGVETYKKNHPDDGEAKHIDLPFVTIVDGIEAQLLEAAAPQSLAELASMKSKLAGSKVYSLLDKDLIPACKEVVRETENFRYLHTIGVGPKEDPELTKWSWATNACTLIITYEDEIASHIYSEIRAKYGPKSASKLSQKIHHARDFFNCFKAKASR